MVDQPLPPTELIHLTYDGNFQLDTEATVLLCRVIDSAAPTNNGNNTNMNTADVDERTNNISINEHDDNDNQKEEKKVMRTNISIELQLDVTTMHPQGGGQPTDIGSITTIVGMNAFNNSNGEGEGGEGEKDVANDHPPIVANIHKVTIDRTTGIATHAGTISVLPDDDNNNINNKFPLNSRVKVSVHPQNRQLLSECHTAGHVVDAAMDKCGKLLKPTKGYHFLDGPYVEYHGSIDVQEREEFLSRLQLAYQELIDEDIPTNIQILSVDEAESLCNRLAQNFNMADFISSPTKTTDNKDGIDAGSGGVVRVVTVAGWNCPCGGTHVRSTGALKERGWGVKGLRCKKNVVRVRYGPKDETD